MTRAVIEALRERLERLRVRQRVSRAERAARLMEHGKRFAVLPVSDPRSPVEIRGEPLLFKGNDLGLTDVSRA